mmetsp:Transcript_51486/g.120720  ORF Transcript_51486/g.120720 Transcript_51486/m.120720 type:complete len:86 (-) Transcript_51486:1035-1292(-)
MALRRTPLGNSLFKVPPLFCTASHDNPSTETTPNRHVDSIFGMPPDFLGMCHAATSSTLQQTTVLRLLCSKCAVLADLLISKVTF